MPDSWVRLPVPVDGLPVVQPPVESGEHEPANTIATPAGFDARDPGTIFAALPRFGTDQPSRSQSFSHVIGPLLTKETLTAKSRSRCVVVDFPYGLDQGSEEALLTSKASVSVNEFLSLWAEPVQISLTPHAPEVQSTAPSEPDPVNPFIVAGYTNRLTTGSESNPFITIVSLLPEGITQTGITISAQPTRRIYDVAISPDGTKVAYLQRSAPYLGWYSQAGMIFTRQAAPAAQPPVYGRMLFSPSGKHLITTDGWDPPYLAVFRVTPTGFEAISNALDVIPSEPINAMGYSPDDAYLILGYGSILRVYERRGDTYVSVHFVATGSTIMDLHWSVDKAYIAVSLNGAPYVKLYTFDGSTLSEFNPGITVLGAADRIRFSVDSKYLAVGTTVTPNQLQIFKRVGSTFTELTTGKPDLGAMYVRSLEWTTTGHLVIQYGVTENGALGVFSVNPSTDAFTHVAGSLLWLPYDVYLNGSLAVYPMPAVAPTPPVNQAVTVPITLSASVSSYDPNNISAWSTTNAQPRLGMGPAVSSTGWTLMLDANTDDEFWELTLPFNVTIDSTVFSNIYITSNSFITFGTGNWDYPNPYDWPAVHKLFVAAYDMSVQRIYTKQDANYFLLRFEGFNAYQGTDPGSSNVIWEVAFIAPDPDTGAQLIEVRMGYNFALENYQAIRSIAMCNPETSLGLVDEPGQGISYIIRSDATGAAWTFTTGASLLAI